MGLSVIITIANIPFLAARFYVVRSLTVLVLKPKYSGRARIIHLALTDYQSSWYQPCRMHRSVNFTRKHYRYGIMSSMASNHRLLDCSTVCSGAHQRKHQSSASLALLWGIHMWPVDSPHKGPVTRKMFPFYDVIINFNYLRCLSA